MSWHDSKLIVGFKDWFNLNDLGSYKSPLEKAKQQLDFVDGYIDVIKKFRTMNAVVVEVRPDKLDKFADEVLSLDPVEFCDYNYLLHTNSYDELIHIDQNNQYINSDDVRYLHNITYDPLAGLGIKIAIIDTGIHPHPYLPSTSFSESINNNLYWHDTVKNQNIINILNNIISIEQSHPSPYSTANKHVNFINNVKSSMQQTIMDVWSSWEQDIINWLNNQRRSSRPEIPLHASIYGAMRMISPDSRNMLNSSLDIIDEDGHGSMTAGLLAARPPAGFATHSFQSSKFLGGLSQHDSNICQSYFNYICNLELDIRGLVPLSELVILKCHETKSHQGDIIALIESLEYCEELDIDIVLCSLTFSKVNNHRDVVLLNRKISELNSKNIVIVSPSGNGSAQALDLPAAFDGVVSITSIDYDKKRNKLDISSFSNVADTASGEEVSFCAFGGEETNRIISTSNNFGFSRFCGTSVSAAIATGIIAREMSSYYMREVNNNYNNLVPTRGMGFINYKNVPYLTYPQNSNKNYYKDKKDHALMNAKNKARHNFLSKVKLPDPGVGYGLIIL